MIKRILSSHLLRLSKKFPVVALMGPRQSGKTTLAKYVFPKLAYVSLEDLDMRSLAEEDPRAFLQKYGDGAIFDEVQKVPKLFSYLQTHVDSLKTKKPYILTGSQNFLLHEKISQTLAGRVALLRLLPLTLEELKAARNPLTSFRPSRSEATQVLRPKGASFERFIFRGFYPRIYDKNINPADFYPSYIHTYVERDIRQIKNVSDIIVFQKFMKLCAGRVGQLLNYSSLASDCGISHNTASSWISLLEASFVVFLLRPHHKNWNKRLVKMPKLYFYDTGLACSLLAIEKEAQLSSHYLFGGLFENFVIAELIKKKFHAGIEPQYYFWRDKSGHEIDCISDRAGFLQAIEIKAGKTVNPSFFKNLEYWNRLSKSDFKNSFVIYGGDENQKRSHGNLVSWRNLSDINLVP